MPAGKITEKTGTCRGRFRFMVGVSGFEPEASWTRTKRDTKLRHTPIDQIIIMRIVSFVKCMYIISGRYKVYPLDVY